MKTTSRLPRFNELLPRDMLTPPEAHELDGLHHAAEPDPNSFVDELVISQPLTPDCSLR